MAKIVLSAAIVVFTSFCGYLFTKRYRRKKLFFSQWNDFNDYFLNEIVYYRRPLGEFIRTHTFSGGFAHLIDAYLLRLKQGDSTWGVAFAVPELDYLNKEEKTAIDDYFQMLGKGDSSSQKVYFSSIKEQILTQRKAAEEACKRYGDLYIKLGFLCGLFIVILIV